MRKKQTMTAAELVAARERLGWSTEKMSEEIGVLPAEASALEAGVIQVPPETAETVRMLVALEERDDILRASGLPECAEFEALDVRVTTAIEEMDPNERHHELETLIAHQAGCPVCQARVAYLNAHAPPMPRMELPLWMRALGGVGVLIDRLPPVVRPPPAPRGEYRRFGIVMGAYLTAFASAITAIAVVLELVTGNAGEPSALRFSLALPLLAVAYLGGGYVAGAVWDATRRIRHRFVGYVLRGGGTAAAMYGAMMLVLPMLKEDDVPVLGYVAGVGALTVFGALAGAGKWLKDRWMDDLPDPPRERSPA